MPITTGLFSATPRRWPRAIATPATLLLVAVCAGACGAQVRPVKSARSSLTPDSGLTQAVVDDAITAHVPAVRACYEKFAGAEGRPMGVVRFGWHVAPSGAVSSVAIVATTLHSAPIEACIADEIGRWQFPSSSRETEITEHPFSF